MTTSTRAGVCVVGSFMMDLIAYAPRRPEPGETLVGTDFVQTAGGKGFNQAVACARAAGSTSMVGRVGTDGFGDEFINQLRVEGIDTTGVGRDQQAGTGVGLPVVSADGQNSIVIVPRANLELTPEHLAESSLQITQAAVVLLQLELGLPATLAAARLAHEAGCRVVLNPAPWRELPDELFDLVDLVVPNEVELAQWVARPFADLEQMAAAATDLAARWQIDLVVTAGHRGALVVERTGEVTHVPARVVQAVDTIGAGDTFCGHLVALLSGGRGLVESSAQANVAASIAVTRRGGAASAPTLAEVVEVMAEPAATTPSTPAES